MDSLVIDVYSMWKSRWSENELYTKTSLVQYVFSWKSITDHDSMV